MLPWCCLWRIRSTRTASAFQEFKINIIKASNISSKQADTATNAAATIVAVFHDYSQVKSRDVVGKEGRREEIEVHGGTVITGSRDD